ncbi:MAG: hypothetical protein ABSH22_21695 [Tepidisphaeraceae bacterium]
MNARELAEATKEFDGELPVGRDGLPGRAPNAIEKHQWNRVKRKMGRPKIGNGVKRVMISLESGLLRQSDGFARKHHLSRSQMISAGLRRLMSESSV